jgi:succinate dehydrogenase/fumarate reductase flavoprotein subunit
LRSRRVGNAVDLEHNHGANDPGENVPLELFVLGAVTGLISVVVCFGLGCDNCGLPEWHSVKV